MLKRRVLTESSKYGPQSGSAQSDKGPSIRERKLESDLDWLKKEKIDGQRKSSGVGKGGNKRRNVWIFTLGGIFGLLIAGLVAKRSDMIDLSVLGGSHFESLLEVLPAALVRDAKELQVWGLSASQQVQAV